MLLPYSTEVVLTRWPFANIAIIAACALVFFLQLTEFIPEEVLDSMVLQSWDPRGLLGNFLLHGDIFHLFFNMVFLWVFGNAVCERLGNLRFAGVFLLCGLYSDMLWLMMDGRPAIGASGAIFGIIGFYLALYPLNKISCAYWFCVKFGSFEVSGYWMILVWFANDLLGVVSASSNGVAHYAHIGGFVSGLVTGLLMLGAGWVSLAEYDNPSLLEYMRKWLGFAEAPDERRPEPEWKRSFSGIPSGPAASQPAARMARTPEVLPMAPEPPPFKASLTPLPALDDITVECPYCQSELQLPRKLLGRSFKCPRCQREVEMAEA